MVDAKKEIGVRFSPRHLRETIEKGFSHFGFEKIREHPILPEAHPSIYYTNSAIIPLISRLNVGDRGDFFVTQRCVRFRNLVHVGTSTFPQNSISLFEMFGAHSSDPHLLMKVAVDVLLTRLEIDAHDLSWKVSSNHIELVKVLIDRDIGLRIDTERPQFYEWSFGESGLIGQGSTLTHQWGWMRTRGHRAILDKVRMAVGCPKQRPRDFANFMRIVGRDGKSYGFALGLETLAATLNRDEWVIDASPDHGVFEYSGPEEAKIADLGAVIATLLAEGERPSRRGRGSSLRRCIIALAKQAQSAEIPLATIARRVDLFAQARLSQRPFKIRDCLLCLIVSETKQYCVETKDLSFMIGNQPPDLLLNILNSLHRLGVTRAWIHDEYETARYKSVTVRMDLLIETVDKKRGLSSALSKIADNVCRHSDFRLRGTLSH